jgi:hypothetical protein
MEDEILRRALAPGPDCLSLDELGRYADGALRGEQRSTAARHIERCPTCQAEFALMQSMTASSGRSGSKRPPHIFSVAAAAAAVLIVVAAGSYYFRLPRAPQLPSTVTTDREVTRSLAIAVRSPVGDQPAPPERLEWNAVDAAVRYRVRLLEVDRRELWSTTTASAVVDVPSTVRASLAPGRTLLWEVTAYDAGGRIISESGVQSFRVLSR